VHAKPGETGRDPLVPGSTPAASVAGAPAPPGAGAAPPAEARPLDLRITENIEAIAISIAMALVLKFFVIEAYQIPTGSMQPEILGDRATGIKDRMLADKLITMLRPPERWEVMIFRFPLDERRLYVKRIVGLPGETLEVKGGDLWIDGRIARKPDEVNEAVLKHVADRDGPMDIGRWFSAEGSIEVQGARATFPGELEPRLLLRRDVLDDYLHGYDPDWGIAPQPGGDNAVCDLEISFVARLGSQARSVEILFESDEADTHLVLPREGSGETARVEILRTAADAPPQAVAIEGELALPAGEDVEVLARYVDRELLLLVDGEPWLRYRDDVSGPRTDRPRRALVGLSMPGGGEVSDVQVRRDIFYLPATRGLLGGRTGRWEIPSDCYFGMGDNTQHSHDSRTWQTVTYVLKDGREITGFDFAHNGYGPPPPDANPQEVGGELFFADVHGDTSRFRPSDVASMRREYAPFIHQRFLLGKAGVVFWPIVNPFRWKLIR